MKRWCRQIRRRFTRPVRGANRCAWCDSGDNVIARLCRKCRGAR